MNKTTTRKLAVFVEGQTEQVFVERYLRAAAGRRHVAIQQARVIGGTEFRRRIILLQGASQVRPYFVMIYDCGGDSRVASDIRDQYQSLVRAGYDLILGMRDLYPNARQKLGAVFAAMSRVLPRGPVPIRVVLAIMEVEAWFLAEETHFPRISHNLNTDLIQRHLDIDLKKSDIEQIEHPAALLHAVYQIVGKAYRKQRRDIVRTCKALDLERMSGEVARRVPSLERFVKVVEEFFNRIEAPDHPQRPE